MHEVQRCFHPLFYLADDLTTLAEPPSRPSVAFFAGVAGARGCLSGGSRTAVDAWASDHSRLFALKR
jgi:hypothetical protein